MPINLFKKNVINELLYTIMICLLINQINLIHQFYLKKAPKSILLILYRQEGIFIFFHTHSPHFLLCFTRSPRGNFSNHITSPPKIKERYVSIMLD